MIKVITRILAVIGLFSILYRINLINRYRWDYGKMVSLLNALSRTYSLSCLLPIKTTKFQKRVNNLLIVFWICFGTVIILKLVEVILEKK